MDPLYTLRDSLKNHPFLYYNKMSFQEGFRTEKSLYHRIVKNPIHLKYFRLHLTNIQKTVG